MYLIGVDCATEPKKTGIALAELGDGGMVRVCEVCADIKDPWGTMADWLLTYKGETILIALDAPLGWPMGLGEVLQDHSAGSPVDKCPDEMFRRYTDRYIKKKIDKRSLDVGADRIARTAHTALKELNILRNKSGSEIPLAWSSDNLEGIQAIEVYPAATLKSHRLRFEGYKNQEDSCKRAREEIATKLRDYLNLRDNDFQIVLDNDDALDAVVCLLAAADFVRGSSMPPPPDYGEIVRREGWIWCFDPESI